MEQCGPGETTFRDRPTQISRRTGERSDRSTAEGARDPRHLPEVITPGRRLLKRETACSESDRPQRNYDRQKRITSILVSETWNSSMYCCEVMCGARSE